MMVVVEAQSQTAGSAISSSKVVANLAIAANSNILERVHHQRRTDTLRWTIAVTGMRLPLALVHKTTGRLNKHR